MTGGQSRLLAGGPVPVGPVIRGRANRGVSPSRQSGGSRAAISCHLIDTILQAHFYLSDIIQ